MPSRQRQTEEESLINRETNNLIKQQWNTAHIIKIIIGTGIGSALEMYSFALVAYFESELKSAFFLTISGEYDSLLAGFALYGTGTFIYTTDKNYFSVI